MSNETEMQVLNRLLDGVEGWLSPDEALLMFELATSVQNGEIVEIGSYYGRSTIALAYGAAKSNSIVYAIDPHHEHEAGGYRFSPANLTPFLIHLAKSHLANYVRIINLFSADAWHAISGKTFDLLWIDGAHDYTAVKRDFDMYTKVVADNGKVAVHDYGSWDGPTRVVDEAVEGGEWVIDRRVDFTVVLKRA